MSGVSIEQLNSMPTRRALEHCGAFFENSPWIVEEALAERPFASLDEFHAACMRVVATAETEKKLKLIRAHPDLVGRLAREGRLGRESTAEQSAAGLSELSPDEVRLFERYNAEYFQRFGFPFVICARKNRKDAILAAFPRRLTNRRNTEIAVALAEIGDIARLRMNDVLEDSHPAASPPTSSPTFPDSPDSPDSPETKENYSGLSAT